MNSRFRLTAAAVAVAIVIAALVPATLAQSGPGIVISEFRFRGTVGGNDEFIELFNASTVPVNVGGWLIRGSNNAVAPAVSTRATIPAGVVVGPGCFYLVVNSTALTGYSGSVPGNLTYGTGITDDGGVAITRPDLTIVDQVGHGANGAFGEGARLPTLTTNANRGIERRPGGTAGHADTNNNAADFQVITPANPQNGSSACLMTGDPAISGTASPSPVQPGQTLTVFAAVVPGTSPVSTGLLVTGNFSQVGGGVAQPLSDDGVAPDVAMGDGVYTTAVVVPPLNPLGARTIALAVKDSLLRSGTGSLSVTVIAPPVVLLPHQVQGSGDQSPLIGTTVTVRGVVTARKSNGFFIQTLVGQDDVDPSTSEGLLIFTSTAPPAGAAVGRLVEVSGAVDEFGSTGVTVTELKGNPTIMVTDLGAALLPAAYPLDLTYPSPSGARNQLERLEGMRVSVASVTATAGTDGQVSEANATSSSFGEVDVVVTGHARPFREPGLEPGTPALTCDTGPCNLPLWDGNPELFRIDTNGIAGTAIRNVSTGAVFTNVTGPLDHAFGNYVILSETQLEPVGGLTFAAAPAAAATEYTVASFNMERFFDTFNDPGTSDVVLTAAAYETRLAKASLIIRSVLSMPDIIGVQEVEKLDVLSAIATRVNTDAGAGNPQYVAYLEEGSDVGGIDVGFLVKTSAGRVTVQSVEQVGFDATFVDPSDSSIDLLNDRPPLVLRATVQGPATSLPQELTVVVNHLRSLNGVNEASATGVRVRAKRKAQAEFLATLIQDIQVGDPSAAVISVGDYNAFSFNDGIGDSMGTIRGEPTAADQVVTASTDLVEPNLVDVAQFIPPAEQYSYVFGGNAQTLDHVIVTATLASQFVDLVHPRINADVAAIFRGDPTSPLRLSDHDPAVAYFTFPADLVAPVFSFTPLDHQASATSPDGATVTYLAPTASDNLDGSVAVTCLPSSGATFPLGNSGVICSAQDLAGNTATTSFTVAVIDDGAPLLTVPANIAAEASSAAGAVVTFSATATDAVDLTPTVSCVPASGSTFAIGATTVNCSASDDAGNTAVGSLTVTVADTTAPVLTVPANITDEAGSPAGQPVSFAASATDLVTASPVVACAPASGTTFPLGITTVTCSATDLAGNTATGSFTITITPPVPGRMHGAGGIGTGSDRVGFEFDVRESADYRDRGTLKLKVANRPGRPDHYFAANVTDVRFSNQPGSAPGRKPGSGVDTVSFTGVGSWNGLPGYTFAVIAADRGEPGRDRDTFDVVVRDSAGTIVATASGALREGNLDSKK